MDDAPDVADKDECQQELEKAHDQSIAVELFAHTGRDHGADTRCEGNAVKDEADNSS